MNQFNYYGTWVLFCKETRRFLSVYLQTIFAPVINAVLFLVVFYPFGGQMSSFGFKDIEYGLFLIPGLLMMSVLQNAFANSSSSIIQAKSYGNITFMLIAPLSALEITIAFVAGSVVRGMLVALAVITASFLFYDLNIIHPIYALLMIFLCSIMMGALGLIAGIWADKYDHLSGFNNFVILPLTFLSGVFYSTNQLPDLWHKMSLWNPFFYMIDSLRFSILGQSDVSFTFSLTIIVLSCFITCSVAWLMLIKGFKIRK